jgi:ketosteroid isomerase-like protein
MDTKEIVTRYYELANAGDWDAWCDLFAPDQVMDEQLAGHIEGLEPLRAMMKGFPGVYARFANTPVHVIVHDDEAAVFSHISAISAGGDGIEANVANYFRIRDGRIAYLTNMHDTRPFEPVVAR